MANKDVAKIDMTVRIVGTVRMKNGKFKYYVHSDTYGPQFWNTREGQELLLAAMEDIDSESLPGQTSETVSEIPVFIEPDKKEVSETDNGWL
ncbi:MAG: hypothetical protein QM500_02855 [Methylococcales bacterium]